MLLDTFTGVYVESTTLSFIVTGGNICSASVAENDSIKILWDFNIICWPSRICKGPDIVVIN